MGGARDSHVVVKAERKICPACKEPVIESNVRRIGERRAEREARNNALRIRLRIPLSRSESDGGPEDLVQVGLSSNRVPCFVIVPDAGGRLHHDRRRENVRPAYAESGLGEAIALREEPRGLGARGNGVTFLLRQPGLAAHKKTVLIRRHDIELEQLASLGIVQDFLDLVIVVAAGDGSACKVRERQSVEKGHAVGIETALLDGVSRDGGSGDRIRDDNLFAVRVEGLRKISDALGRGGHGVLRERAGNADRPIFEGVKAEQQVFLGVEFSGDVDGPAERRAERVVAVLGPRNIGAVVEEVVGVEILIAHVPVAAAVVILAAGLGHHFHYRSSVACVFRLVTVEDHLDLADGIQGRDARKRGGRSQIVAHDSVHSEDIVAVGNTADIRRGSTEAAAHGILVGLILHAGNGPQERDNVTPARGQVTELGRGELGGMLRAVGLHHSALGFDGDGVCYSADLKLDIACRHPLVGAHHHAGSLERLESTVLYPERVDVRGHRHEVKRADFVASSGAAVTGLLAG